MVVGEFLLSTLHFASECVFEMKVLKLAAYQCTVEFEFARATPISKYCLVVLQGVVY